ncbi:MAG: hypothetical protein K0S44_221 [Bacteroidetes bacterium]|jgi:hypothetical protein|nr:hypothetical protein [Bacteroidota bacterium]
MVTYESAVHYIESATTLREQINKIDNIINALFSSALKAAANDSISEYSLDDGQTKIRTVYKNSDAVMASIESFRKLKKCMLADLNNTNNGRLMRLVDSKNLNRKRNGRL